MAQPASERKKDLVIQLQLMRRNKIFTKEEIKEIINKRVDLESKLKKDDKCKMDHANLIKFESALYQEIKRRRERYRITKDVDKIDLPLAQYIGNLYTNTLHCYPGNMGMWVAFVTFGTRMGFLDLISKTLTAILKSYTGRSQLWLLASKWERQQNKSLKNAFHYLSRGLQNHPKDASLLTEAYNFILLKARDQGKDLKKAEMMYKSASKKVNDVEFVLGLLEVTERFDFTESLQKKIIADVKMLYPQKEVVFHAIAQNALKCKTSVKMTSTEKFQSCIAFYKEAIKLLPTDKMWAFYIDYLLSLNKDHDVYLIDERKALLEAVEEAHGVGMLNAAQYLSWLRILDSEGDREAEMSKLVPEVAARNFTSVELWKSLMTFYIIDEKPDMVRQMFNQAVKILGEDSLPVWNLMLINYLSRPQNSEKSIRNIFLEAVQQPGKVSQYMKPKYLEYLVITKNITFARNAYVALATRKPYCLKLHQTMDRLEGLQLEPDLINWRVCHDNATNLFGKTNKDVWINYIKFEKIHGDSQRIPTLYTKAKQTLEATLVVEFETEYNKVINSSEDEME